jgi:hypothetical protein
MATGFCHTISPLGGVKNARTVGLSEGDARTSSRTVDEVATSMKTLKNIDRKTSLRTPRKQTTVFIHDSECTVNAYCKTIELPFASVT